MRSISKPIIHDIVYFSERQLPLQQYLCHSYLLKKTMQVGLILM